MTDHPMDGFDSRLAGLLAGYGDEAVAGWDAATIARAAMARPAHRPVVVPGLVASRGRLVLVAAALVALAVAIALAAGARRSSAPIGDAFALPTTIAWSPDGASLAFAVDVGEAQSWGVPGRHAHAELWLAATDGGEPRRLAVLGASIGPPVIRWTPDSSGIVVNSQVAQPGEPERNVLTKIGLQGEAPRVLMDGGSAQLGLGPTSPDGRRVLVQGPGDLWVLDLVSGDSIRLTTTGATCCAGFWSPDGRWVLYSDGVGSGSVEADSTTSVTAADGSVTHVLGPCCELGWSPDGRAWFQATDGALRSARPDGTDVRIESVAGNVFDWTPNPAGDASVVQTPGGLALLRSGTAPVPLTSDPDDAALSWSPDGAWIAFDGVRDGVGGVYLVPAAGGTPHLAAQRAQAAGDAWRPGPGREQLALLRDGAVIAVGVDGSVSDLVGRSSIAATLPPAPSIDPGWIVIGPDGPDRVHYAVASSDPFVLNVDNRSDVGWTVMLDGFDVLGNDCHVVGDASATLAVFRRPASSGTPAPAFPPDVCRVGPGERARITPGIRLTASTTIRAFPDGGSYTTSYPILIDPVETP